VADKSKKKLVSELSKNMSSHGLSVMLKLLKLTQLKALAKYCEWGDTKVPSGKATIAKKIHDTMEETSPKEFLEGCDSDLLKEIIVKELEVDLPAAKKDYPDTIITAANNIGLENCFSSFSIPKLKEFVKACGLKVDSDSLDSILQCLVEQISIKAPYEPKGESPSNKQPEIDKNIKVVDLYCHYYREDLSNFCEEKNLNSHGSKKELIDRIRRFFDGKLIESKDIRKEKKRKSEEGKETKTSEEESESSGKRKKPKKEKEESDSEGSKKGKKNEKEKKKKRKNTKRSQSEEPNEKK